ncbi:MAG TPA: hypothetical protein VN025_20825 [Candidatus Dormibacteraeota bacterium]|jgi:hypothetical protein|nr:hypothetical protein [Candidatus Dormibacteraeota bacterium]
MRLLNKSCLSVSLACAILLGAPARSDAPQQNWTNFVRIGAYGLSRDNTDKIIRDAQATHVFGIEVDNDIPGRYESFLDPAEKLGAIKTLAEKAHRAGNKAFVYIAGTECITANAEKSAHSIVKDHPDWLQRKITGEPAVFTSGAAFWIRPGDEDVWISPYAEPWRKIYMERVRQIAATGIDGIYVDIPYWMTHFDGWEDTWASFDEFTVGAFKQKTGLDARKDIKLGDFSDGNFRKWVDFRISTFTDFMRDIRDNARSVNPSVKVIPEIYPGIEEEAVRVGADVYELYGVVDAIAHEYEFGGGDHMAASRTQLDWFLYQAGMLSFRAFAQGKATWLLNYSWDGDKDVDAREAMKTLAGSQVMAGVNFWDAPGHSMAGSNDAATRTEIFQWIERHEKTLYHPRSPIQPVGVYFSPASRNYDAAHFLPSFRGTILLLLQKHRELQVVTPRTLTEFHGPVLVLPDVSILSDAERAQLRNFIDRDGRLVITGSNPSGLPDSQRVIHFSSSPGATHLASLEKDFMRASQSLDLDLLSALPDNPQLIVEASPFVVSHIASVDGKPHIFFANFSGIVPHHNVKPTLESSARVTTAAGPHATLTFLPFLGEEQILRGERSGDKATFHLPPFERGAVVWLNDSK